MTESQEFKVDSEAAKHLGKYVYALIDPRDQKVFYVGQGLRGRIDAHFSETRAAMSSGEGFTSKIRRIQNIWEEGHEVQIYIVRRGLETQAEADHVEGACIALLGLSQNGATYNLNSGPHSTGHGAISLDEVGMLNALPINPSQGFNQVFVFNTNSDTNDSEALYATLRGDWIVTQKNRNRVPAYAVALSRGVSKGVFKIALWEPSGEKFRFVKSEADQSSDQLLRKNWSAIIGATPGFWQRGQYLILNFDGEGHFQFVRGLPSNDWLDLTSESQPI